MNLQKYKTLAHLTIFALGATIFIPSKTSAQENGSTPGAEVLTRGPVHEAFAGTVSFNPEPGIIVDRAPPVLIEEVPPEQRLEGDNVVWIPGYWAWDEDQNDFLWISGIWRNLPPGREWIPGYWSEVDGRHQWTSGYWEDSETTEVSYLPEPPRSVEAGPSVKAASDDQTWIPGNWVYRDYRYAWRAGYWVTARPNWIWTPAYYRWTHRGYVYVDGYWDYPVVSRGVVFAPVHFHRDYIARPNFYYSPVTVIALSVFTNHLFLRPNYCHYYFGDYYEPRYRDHGYYASYSYYSGRRGYDPFYAHQRWEHRHDRNWDRQRQEYYEYRRDRADARPPRTWAALNARSEADRERGDFAVADRLDRVAAGKRGDGRQRFKAVNPQERERFVAQKQEVRKFAKERQQLETTGDRPKAGDKDARPTQVKVNRSPVKSNKSDRSDAPARLQPRASEQERDTAQTGKNGKRQQADRDDPTNKKDEANREGTRRKNDKSEETRTKPGEKREAEPDSDRKTKPNEKRQAEPDRDRKDQPGEKRQGEPDRERKAEPGEKRQADPTPERQADPSQGRLTEPGQKRQAEPTPERRPDTAPQRQAEPNRERKATPTPKREAEPERKAKPEEKRESATNSRPQTPRVMTQRSDSKPSYRARSQDQATNRPLQQKIQQRSATRQENKAQSTSRQAATKEEESDREKKNR
jgi:hypothetical protein